MSSKNNDTMIPQEVIISKIYLIREQKVMIDRDLAELYGVATKVLKQAVKRNISRFPIDFMFEMTKEELENWRSQFVTSNSDKMGLRYAPFCFTEQGVAMLSSILNSEKAIEINIRVIRIFTKLREMLMSNKDLLFELEQIKKQLKDHSDNFLLIFEYLKQLEEAKHHQLEQENRKKIGYKSENKKE